MFGPPFRALLTGPTMADSVRMHERSSLGQSDQNQLSRIGGLVAAHRDATLITTDEAYENRRMRGIEEEDDRSANDESRADLDSSDMTGMDSFAKT